MSPNKTLEERKNVMVYSDIKQKVEDLETAVVLIVRFHDTVFIYINFLPSLHSTF
ncbi:hypothetical protein [Sporosarcina sp. JAI121]|uniref:hypothetical protein n=1 Tax=Sporosarcina sp. JAI121 TaxID=2723064 RepID=UPI0015CD938D|nr:hypothetical protein [Sporosarcina sp. JAI121]NYF24378.1 hypothetical protein [Sporosarcina sp. JAI121]